MRDIDDDCGCCGKCMFLPKSRRLLQATRYNYTLEEKSAFIELIGMVKSVQSHMFRCEPLLMRGIYFFIYKELQDFMHGSLPEPLRKATKRNKEILKGYLHDAWILKHTMCVAYVIARKWYFVHCGKIVDRWYLKITCIVCLLVIVCSAAASW